MNMIQTYIENSGNDVRLYKRVWAMPNKYTFEIPPIRKFILSHIEDAARVNRTDDINVNASLIIVDPFCGNSTIGTLRNDIRISGIDSEIWLHKIASCSADIVLFDPVYSPRQKKECYDDIGMDVTDTTSGYWKRLRDEIQRITKPYGRCLSFGWNSVGIGKNRGFEFIPFGLMVSHGGNHNDTICTAEYKIPENNAKMNKSKVNNTTS